VKYTPQNCRGGSMRKHATTKVKINEVMAKVAKFPFKRPINEGKVT